MAFDETGKFEPTLTFHEILVKVNNAKDKPKKLEVLKHYDTAELRMVLKSGFDPNITWELPEGKPPYREDDAPAGMQLQSIDKAIRQLGYLVPNSGYDNVKKETMFIQMLESIHQKDAAIVVAAKDGKLQDLYSKVTINLAQDSFPKLFPISE